MCKYFNNKSNNINYKPNRLINEKDNPMLYDKDEFNSLNGQGNYLFLNDNNMIDKINKVKKFHEVFLIGNEDKPKAIIDESTFLLRHRLMHEENEEYLQAAKEGDLVEIADALGDKLYILCGTILAHGLQDKIVEVFDEIQRSNMSKLSADGTPVIREDGKILKGPNYLKPNIKSILEK